MVVCAGKKNNLARHCHLNLNCLLVRRLLDNLTSLLCAEKKIWQDTVSHSDYLQRRKVRRCILKHTHLNCLLVRRLPNNLSTGKMLGLNEVVNLPWFLQDSVSCESIANRNVSGVKWEFNCIRVWRSSWLIRYFQQNIFLSAICVKYRTSASTTFFCHFNLHFLHNWNDIIKWMPSWTKCEYHVSRRPVFGVHLPSKI